MHDDGVVWQQLRTSQVKAVSTAVLGTAREERSLHALLLDAQHHDDVDVGQHCIEVVGHFGIPRFDTDRQQRGRRDQHRSCAKGVEQQHVRTSNTAVQHIADNGDSKSAEVSGVVLQVSANRERIEQCLRGVLVGTVTGVDDDRRDPTRVRQLVRRATCAVSQDHGVSTHGLKRQRSVLEALALRDAGTLSREVDDIGRQPLCSSLERDASAGAVFEEQIDDSATAQGWQLLDRTVSDRSQLRSSVENQHRVVMRQVCGRYEMALHSTSPALASLPPKMTASAPSVSASWTRTVSRNEVGKFLPT